VTESFGLPFKATTTVQNYADGADPAVDAPIETVEGEFWFEADGTLVIDNPERVAEIEAGIARLEEFYAAAQG
jgi:hypothetical protein